MSILKNGKTVSEIYVGAPPAYGTKVKLSATDDTTVTDAIIQLQNNLGNADLLGGHPSNYFGTAEDVAQLEGQINNVNEKIQETNSRIYNPNLLHNWDFRNPVNQRGQTNYEIVGSRFVIDRWTMIKESGTEPATLKITANGIEITSPSDGNTIFEQVIEISDQYANLPLTFSLKLSAYNQGSALLGVYSYNGTEYEMVANNRDISAHDSGQIISTSGKVSSAMNWMRVRILVSKGTTIICESAKLEVGSVSTLANDPPMDYGAELAKCQRYYEESSVTIGGSHRTDAYALLNAIQFKVPKRLSSPTINLVNPYTGAVGSIRCGGDGKDYTVIVNTKSETEFSIYFTEIGFPASAQFVVKYTASAEL